METLQISLAAARINAKMTQEDVARKMHVSKGTIVNWESGKISPKHVQLCFLSELYGIPVDNIFLPKVST